MSQSLVPVRIWIVAMLKYHETLKIVNPLREQAAEKGKELAIVEAALAEKRAKVKEIEDNLNMLNTEKAELEAKAAKLDQDLDMCKKKIVRANKMIEGLAGEKERWTSTVA